MMSFMQKKMVVIAIVAIARGNGVVASDSVANADASPAVGNRAEAADVVGGLLHDMVDQVAAREEKSDNRCFQADAGVAVGADATEIQADTEQAAAGAAGGKKGWAAKVTGLGRSAMSKVAAGAKAVWNSHGKPAWDSNGKPVVTGAYKKHVKPTHEKMHAAYKTVADHPVTKKLGALKRAVIPDDPFTRAHLLKPVVNAAESMAEKAKLRGAEVKSKITAELNASIGKEERRSAGCGVALLLSCLGKQCGCGPWSVMRGLIKLALKPLTKQLNATVYGAALVGCLGFVASKNERELETWCSKGCGMQSVVSAGVEKAHNMAPSEAQVQAGLENFTEGVVENLKEAGDLLKARMGRKNNNSGSDADTNRDQHDGRGSDKENANGANGGPQSRMADVDV